MIDASNILKSKKKVRKYEKILIKKIKNYFINLGFSVIPNARFNISWGSITSDLDLLLLKENEITIVEVKSKHDTLSRAKNQIKKITDFADYVYLATDVYPKKFIEKSIGLIYVTNNGIEVIKDAKKIIKLPDFISVASLQKKCLLRRLNNITSERKDQDKYNIALSYFKKVDKNILKNELKEIVTCGLKCELNCPIWKFIDK